MDLKSVYLIQGLFFQPKFGLRVQHDEQGKKLVFPQKLIMRSMFTGMMGPEAVGSTTLVGRLTDGSGDSVLQDIELDGYRFNFTKKYERRTDTIRYEFKRQSIFWVGSYYGLAVGEGKARCVLLAVPDEFLEPPKTE